MYKTHTHAFFSVVYVFHVFMQLFYIFPNLQLNFSKVKKAYLSAVSLVAHTSRAKSLPMARPLEQRVKPTFQATLLLPWVLQNFLIQLKNGFLVYSSFFFFNSSISEAHLKETHILRKH